MKTIRRLRISLFSREVLRGGFSKEETRSNSDEGVCPLCHSPLSTGAPLVTAINALTNGEANSEQRQDDFETKNLKGGKE